MKVLLHEDPVARGWEPFATTRPIGELLYGALKLRERIERAFGTSADGYVAPHLDGFDEADACPSRTDLGGEAGPAAVLTSRYVPPLPGEPGHFALSEAIERVDRAARLVVGDAPAGWLVGSGADSSAVVDAIRAGEDDPGPDFGGEIPLPGHLLSAPWDLMAGNADRLTADLAILARSGAELGARDGVTRIGGGRITVEGDVTVDPGCVLDTRSGPIHLAAGVDVRPFTYVRGPAVIGRGTSLFGGTFESVSIGPGCRLRGEISEAIFLGFANKAHDGYIGHSIIGRWVNLGAFTTNSDLKNNYGEIRVGAATGAHESGMIKVGVFVGDHVKTGIGTRMNGGTVIGAGSNIYGDGFPPRWVPPFHWGSGADLAPHRLEAFLETAERAMGRRDVRLSSEQRAFLTRAWERVHGSAS